MQTKKKETIKWIHNKVLILKELKWNTKNSQIRQKPIEIIQKNWQQSNKC